MTANSALLWAQTLVDEWARCGLRRAVIAPGSRSTPLTLALTAQPQIECSLHLDERSAAFYALGLAQADGEPAALVCTSGTAVAEFFPAVIEASQSGIPLLLLTADRPPELRDSGANQTIDQVKIYGGYLRWQADLAAPEAEPPALTLRYLRASAARAYAAAKGLAGTPGPVHLNIPFRKPLEPADRAQWQETTQQAAQSARPNAPWTQIQAGPRTPTPAQLDDLAALLSARPHGLIVVGPRPSWPDGFAPALLRLAQQTGYPILADPLSGLRCNLPAGHTVIGGYTLGLAGAGRAQLPPPQIVLRFGAPPTSDALNSYLAALPAEVPQLGVQRDGRWLDDGYMLSHLLAVDEARLCDGLAAHMADYRPDAAWLAAWQRLDAGVQAALAAAPPCEGRLVREMVACLPPGCNLVVANSLPIRHVDEFVPASARPLQVFGNRGASGIDGTISTALGIAAASPAPTVLLTGDLSFYHDQNGLLALKQAGLKLTIVLLNNDGGGIFHRLPVARFEPPFRQWFITPHGLEFQHAARQYGLSYQTCTAAELPVGLAQALAAPQSSLLEIHTDAAQSHAIRQALIQSIFTPEVRNPT